jgi:nitrous oxidase accessory protein
MSTARSIVIALGLAAASNPAPAAEPSAPAALPEGAEVASFDELVRAVADPAGPASIALRRGTYRGDLVIRRPLALRGESGATLAGTGASTVITIDANDVTIEGLRVTHSGRRSTTEDAAIKATGERVRVADVRVDDSLFGVSFQQCHGCTLERVKVEGSGDDEIQGDAIKLWESHGSIVRGCEVDHARDVVVWYTRRALVEDNVVRHSRYGTHFMYAHDGVARRNRVEGNVVGIFVMYSLRLTVEDNVLAGAHGAAGMGIGFKESDDVRLARNWLVANTTGVYLDDSPRTKEHPVTFDSNVLALNDVAVRLHFVDKGASFHGNAFRDNGETIAVDGGGDGLGLDVRGNYFADYEGYDLNGDGVGDVPYRVNALSSELADGHPALRFFHGTTAMHLVDAIAHAVPVLESHTLLADPAPLVRAPEVPRP